MPARRDTTREIARASDLFDDGGEALDRSERPAGDDRAERRGQQDAPKGHEDEPGPRLGEHGVDVGQVARELEGAAPAEGHDEHPIVGPADGRVEIRVALLLRRRDLLRRRRHEGGHRLRVVGADHLAGGVDALSEDVTPTRHRLTGIAERRTATSVSAAGALGLRGARGLVEALVHLRDELLLQHDEHEDRRAHDRDGHRAGGDQGDAQAEAHAARIT